VKKIAEVENDAVARVDWMVVSQSVTREVVNVMREVVKTNNVLVKVMGGALISKLDGLEPA
jgi:hypothetical protein